MSSLTNHYRHFLFGLFVLVLLTVAQTASAQWWRFGSDASQPVFSDLLFNNVSALRVERSLQFSQEDLNGRKVVVRGRAEVGQGKIGRVEASLDDGISWTPIPVGERGLFAFELTPEIERPYRFKIRALSTTGQSSDEAEHAFEFKVVREDNRALAKAAFQQLLERYMARDRTGFMSLVSREFLGNETALDSALGNDFRFFDSIRIDPTIQRMAASDNRWTIYFNFRRQVRSVRSGQMLTDQAMTSVTLIRDGDGYKLQELAAPLIFGVSDPSNVATYVTDESVGRPVLVVDEKTGEVSTQKQGQTTDSQGGGSGNISEGSITLQREEGFSFRTLQKVSNILNNTSFAFGMDFHISWGDEFKAGVLLPNVSSLNDVGTVVVNDGDQPPPYLNVGGVIALKLQDDTYAIIRLSSQSGQDGPWTFQYRYQRNGSANFK